LLNYALGLTRVRFRDYVLASVGMLPGSLLYTYYGKLAGDVAMLAGDGPVEVETYYYLVLVLGLTAIILLTSLITRIASRALHRGTGK
ncbi:MAG: TVP38/TMEM64 family protein, partial [Acidobacteriota bacterium]|nr:TVP38/TMEM64 family protein [Acidobacteriota bacterium]